jgi:hypothetical protein
MLNIKEFNTTTMSEMGALSKLTRDRTSADLPL